MATILIYTYVYLFCFLVVSWTLAFLLSLPVVSLVVTFINNLTVIKHLKRLARKRHVSRFPELH